MIVRTKLLRWSMMLAVAIPAWGNPAQAGEPTEAEVLDDDVLAVIDLPLVVHAALTVEVAPTDVELVLSTTSSAGLSAGEVSRVLHAEVEEAKRAGKPRPGLGSWVRREVAKGVRGEQLAAKIAARKAEDKPIPEAEDKRIVAQLDKLKTERKAEREKIQEKRKAMLAEGKALRILWKAEHDAQVQALKDAKPELEAAKKSLAKGEKLAAGKALGQDPDFVPPGQAKKAGDEPEPPGQAGKEDKEDKGDDKGDDKGNKGGNKADAGNEDDPGANPGKSGEKPGKAGDKPGKSGEGPSKGSDPAKDAPGQSPGKGNGQDKPGKPK